MTTKALDGLEADTQALLDICSRLEAGHWQSPSGCQGWSVKDLVAHMGVLFWLVVDASALPDASGRPTEEAQDFYVQSRRDWAWEDVLDDYRAVQPKALAQLSELSVLDFDVPLGDLGTYPARLLPNAFCFDHFTHIRADLFAPRGPLTMAPPACDEIRVVPVLDWVEAALPQQNVGVLSTLPGAVDLVVEGRSAQTLTAGAGPRVATVVAGDALSFVRWITQRGSWEELDVRAAGDEGALTTARSFKVF
jgi:uncharacterized protein (TIGR03083 family)